MQTDLFNAQFDGSDYKPKLDKDRLKGQLWDIFKLMKDQRFRTLDEIHRATGHPHASISAQLRNLRKERFGGHLLNKQRKGMESAGLWEYQLIETL